MEGRGSFYESTGCLRDMISTHLCQLLGFVALEDPGAFEEGAVRDAKAAVFQATAAAGPRARRLRPVRRLPRRGRRRRGLRRSRRSWPSRPTSTTTAGATCRSTCAPASGWRARDRVITLRFRASACDDVRRRARRPEPAQRPGAASSPTTPHIHVDMRAKRPGPDMEPGGGRDAARRGRATRPHDDPLEAYERLLLDVLRGDQTLFTRSDEVDRLWQVCQPVLDAPPPVQPYEPGSWGPQAALRPARRAAGGCMADRTVADAEAGDRGLPADRRSTG